MGTEAGYNTVALALANLANGLWSFHFAVLLGALGWGISSRSWKAGGLSWPLCFTTALAVQVFGAANIYSVLRVSDRLNAALTLAQARAVGSPTHVETLYARWEWDPGIYLALDAVAACGVAVLLSNVGRPARSDTD